MQNVNSFTISSMDVATVHRFTKRRAIGGFTLVELMIVVAVIAILALVAYPTYVESVRKSRRADAIALMSKVAQAQERWRANASTYANDFGASALSVNSTAASGVTSLAEPYYTITVPTNTGTDYTVRAVARQAQASDTQCLGMELRMVGGNVAYISAPSTNAATIAASTTDANRCWNR